MSRWLGIAPLLCATLALGACEPDTPPSPSAAQLAARAYLLSPSGMSGYSRTTDAAIGPSTLADQHKDPALGPRLTALGFRDGALSIYAPSRDSRMSLPFQTLSLQSVIFNEEKGASRFFVEEQKRLDQAPPLGTIGPLVGAPANRVDDIVAYDSSQPSITSSMPTRRAFVALVRKGQVTVEIYGYAGADQAVPGDFTAYVSAEELLLQTPPQ